MEGLLWIGLAFLIGVVVGEVFNPFTKLRKKN